MQNRATSDSIDGLNPDDPGIGLLSDAVRGVQAREIVLVCCGDIPGVGPEATRLVLDVRERPGAVARVVPITESAGLSGFGHAIVWPRPHLGKDFSLLCLARAALSLRPGGTLWCAARKSKGAKSLVDVLGRLTGAVDVVGRSRGYQLARATRTERFDPAAAQQLVAAEYALEDEDEDNVWTGPPLRSAPGVFARRGLDAGTRQLLRHAGALSLDPAVVLDLGCGIGPLGLWAARRWTAARVVMVDSNLRAVALAQDNAARLGVDARVRVLASDGLPQTLPMGIEPGEPDLALCNPPTHDPAALGRFARQLSRWLRPGSPSLWVVNRTGRMSEALASTGARLQTQTYDRFSVIDARWG